MQNTINKNDKQFLDWLLKLCQSRISHRQSRMILASLALLQKWSTTRGAAGIKKWKTISDDLIRAVVTGKVISKPPRTFSWALDLGLNGNWRTRVLVITCLCRSRVYRAKPSKTIASIVEPSLWKPFRFLKLAIASIKEGFSLREWGGRAEKFKPFKWVTSWTAGPNGSPSWKFPLEDFQAVAYSNFRWSLLYLWGLNVRPHEERIRVELYKCLRLSVERCGGLWNVLFRINPPEYVHSKLAFLSDKAGKTRVVAIGDLWSQSVLLGYHDRLFSLLRLLRRVDGTFDQDKQRARVAKWSSQNYWMSSVDMSNATDRLPAKVIAWVLWWTGLIRTLSEATAWLRVMRSREFVYDYTIVKSKRTTVKRYATYAVGQPMGLLSSWAAFAVTHHALVQLAAYTVGYRTKVDGLYYFTRYAILGDDIVIADQKVAVAYKRILGILDVSFSIPKSWEGVGLAEFAKSLYCKGLDVSSLPHGLMSFKQPYLNIDVVLLFWSLCQKGWTLTLEEYWSTLPKGVDRNDVYLGLTYPGYAWFYPSSVWDEFSRTYVEILALQSRFRTSLTRKNSDFVYRIEREDPYYGRAMHTPSWQLGVQVMKSQVIVRMNDDPWFIVGPGFVACDPETPYDVLRAVSPIEEVLTSRVTQELMKSRRSVRLRSLSRVATLTGSPADTTYIPWFAYSESRPVRGQTSLRR